MHVLHLATYRSIYLWLGHDVPTAVASTLAPVFPSDGVQAAQSQVWTDTVPATRWKMAGSAG